ncbi:hypothetical protein K8352_17880 [Flavobacteriaceae bacterium F89]|uniref:Lipid-binding hydrolase n=1 Tax=Cerina litoralis TaxID=2874477 RepID=A0AAE3EZS1_9FLAO|nr:lipid-binding protein [Cerina litoralis]MCG2462636.1 hypothetical protein [Cerina litoralis]
MKNLKIYKIVLTLFVAVFFVACDEGGDPDPGATEVVEMAGDWYVQFLVDGEDIYGLGYQLISTYNTAANDGTEMWIDDHGNTWQYKVKCPVNTSSLTFSGTGLNSNVDGYEVSVDVTNGTIVKNGATSTGGNTVDAISFDAVFSDDPSTTYHMEGYRRTGLLEDEH